MMVLSERIERDGNIYYKIVGTRSIHCSLAHYMGLIRYFIDSLVNEEDLFIRMLCVCVFLGAWISLKMVLGVSVIILNYFGGYLKVILTTNVFCVAHCVTFPIEAIMIPKNFCTNKFGQTKALSLSRSSYTTHNEGFGGVKRFLILVVSSFSLCVRSFGFVVAVGHWWMTFLHFIQQKLKMVYVADTQLYYARMNWKHWKRKNVIKLIKKTHGA